MDAGVHDMSHYSNVEGWLISIKMEKYINNFLQAGYRTMEQVSTISNISTINMNQWLLPIQFPQNMGAM